MKKALLFFAAVLIIIITVSCTPEGYGTVEIDFNKDSITEGTYVYTYYASLTDVAIYYTNHYGFKSSSYLGHDVTEDFFGGNKTTLLLPAGPYEMFVDFRFSDGSTTQCDIYTAVVEASVVDVEDGQTIKTFVNYTIPD